MEAKCPEQESHVTEDKREGAVPDSIMRMIDQQRTEDESIVQKKKQRFLVTVKNATPGQLDDPDMQTALDNVEPRCCIVQDADATTQRQQVLFAQGSLPGPSLLLRGA